MDHAASRGRAVGGQRVLAGAGEIAVPVEGLGGDQPERIERLSGRAAGDGSFGPRDRAWKVVPLQRREGGPVVPGSCAFPFAPVFEVLRQRERLRVPARLEPRSRQAVTQSAILLGEHRVGGVAQQRVPEGIEGFGRPRHRCAIGEELALDQLRELSIQLAAPLAPEHLQDAFSPEGVAEDAGTPQEAPGERFQRLQARRQHREHAGRRLASGTRSGMADELLQMEDVAVREVDQPR